MSSWLVLDCNYLAWRAFFAMPSFEHDGLRTQVLFGFFKDILYLRDYFNSNRFVFCFDSPTSKRKELFAGYKSARSDKYKQLEDEQKKAYDEMRQQVRMLEHRYLPAIGFRNIFSQDGYESDDMIAVVCSRLPHGDDAVIVSSDQDLYQLLRDGVVIWHPQKKQVVDRASFAKEYGVEPSQWVDVKAIAGCSTDEVPGVKGVGEKTAAKFLAGNLKPTSKAYQAIVEHNDLWKSNLQLVTLPFPGASIDQFRDDEVTRSSWDAVMDRLGMKSMMRSA